MGRRRPYTSGFQRFTVLTLPVTFETHDLEFATSEQRRLIAAGYTVELERVLRADDTAAPLRAGEARVVTARHVYQLTVTGKEET